MHNHCTLPFRFAASLAAFAAVIATTPMARAQTLYVDSDRTIAGGNPLSGPYTDVYVGVSSTNQTFVSGVHADFVTGTNITGTLRPFSDNSVTTLYNGSVNTVTHGGNSTFNMQGGTVGTVNGGFLDNINGGTITQGVDARYGNFNINGGDIKSVFFGNTTSFPLNATVNGGVIRGVTGVNFGYGLYSEGNLTVTGGTINDGVFYLASTLRVQGGNINGGLQLGQGNGVISTSISGGAFQNGIYNLNNGITTFYGSGITLTSATPGMYTSHIPGATYNGTYYTMSGTFQNGQSAANTVFFAANRADGQTGYNIITTSSAPEPGSLLLALPFTAAVYRAANRRSRNRRFSSLT